MDQHPSPSNRVKSAPEDTSNSRSARKAALHDLGHTTWDVHEVSDGPSPLDGRRDGNDMQLHLQHQLARTRVSTLSGPYDDAELTTGKAVATNKGIDERQASRSNFPAKGSKSDACVDDRTEIPNTPTQRSSQIESNESAANIQHLTLADIARRDNTSFVIEQPRTEKVTHTPVLCVACRKQHVLSKEAHIVTW